MRPNARIRLYCFPYAGGSGSTYRSWGDAFSEEIEVRSVQYPGRAFRLDERPKSTMDELIDSMGEALYQDLTTDDTYVFFGHSMGALVAFELTRWLNLRGYSQPEALYLSGGGAPRHSVERFGVAEMTDPELIALIEKFGGTPDEVLQNERLMRLVLPMVRADFTLLDGYEFRCSTPVEVPIFALGGLEDKVVGAEDLLKWSELTKGKVEVQLMSGGHFYVHSPEEELWPYLRMKLES
ncbi:MAG: alpha/beta fold hydrolase [Myxococcota bacterium]|nr:alpha/beta fold hydrolase [Myxococcota bacterium]